MTWEEAKDAIVARFGVPMVDPFRSFKHLRLRQGQPVKEYFDKKRRLGQIAELTSENIISGLTDGLPPEMERMLAGVTIRSPSQWIVIAQRLESVEIR